jgi:hypothetical protein
LVSDLAPAVTAGLIRILPDGAFQFANALIRETIYEDVPVARRIDLHCRIGAAIETRDPDLPGDALALLAYHFCQGQPQAHAERARAYAAAAGRQAFGTGAYGHAVAFFEQAIALLERDDTNTATERGELLIGLAESAWRADDPARARQAAREAVSAARRLGSGALLARAALSRPQTDAGQPADEEERDLLREALDGLGPDDSVLRTSILARLTPAALHHGATMPAALSPDANGAPNQLIQEGEFWTFCYRRLTCRLRDRAGVQYLSLLLEQPQVEVASLDLIGIAEEAEVERDVSTAEQARVRVTRALRRAIAQIRALDRRLGDHLARSVRTGTVCRYVPPEPTAWTVVRAPVPPGRRRSRG